MKIISERVLKVFGNILKTDNKATGELYL